MNLVSDQSVYFSNTVTLSANSARAKTCYTHDLWKLVLGF